MREHTILPEERRGLLRSQLETTGRPLRFLEAHSGLSAMVVETSQLRRADGEVASFDGIWVSGLTESASRGLPDIELMGMHSRLELTREIVGVTSKPLLVDGDTGGTAEQLKHTLQVLEDLGVSGIIIEDKIFPKNNSLDLGKEQVLENPDVFAAKIQAGRRFLRSKEFMLIARIEALIAGRSVEEALLRAEKYLAAGADAIVIHSRQKESDEILEFAREYSKLQERLRIYRPLICIPTTYNSVRESELAQVGCRLVIHANHLLRSAHQAMKQSALTILEHGRSAEVDPYCTPLNNLFRTIERDL